MPQKIPTPCSHRGCPRLVVERFCEEHAKESSRIRRKAYQRPKGSDSIYSSPIWVRSSQAFRRRHPLCAICLKKGEYTPSEEVDHIEPHRGDLEKFWSTSNWQALCKPCHSSKTQKEINARRN